MDMTNIFTNSTDFSGIFNSLNAGSEIVQKVFIEVSESGTEAAPVTGKLIYMLYFYHIYFYIIIHFCKSV